MNHSQRIQALRDVELECYRICYFLLENEASAWRAASAALVLLYKNEHFYRSTGSCRSRLMRRVAAECSLQA